MLCKCHRPGGRRVATDVGDDRSEEHPGLFGAVINNQGGEGGNGDQGKRFEVGYLSRSRKYAHRKESKRQNDTLIEHGSLLVGKVIADRDGQLAWRRSFDV